MKNLFLLILAGAGALVAQTPTVTAVVNTAELNGGIEDTRLCPGIIATILGTNFGSSSSNVTVTVGRTNAAPVQVSPNRIDVQISFDATVGKPWLTVTVGGIASTPFIITLTGVAPTVGLTGPSAVDIFSAMNVQVTAAAPAHPGDTLILYGAGLGQTNPATTDFQVYSSPVLLATIPTVTVGGERAEVTFAGYGGAGVYQIHFIVPNGVQGSVPLILSIDGQDSPLVTLPLTGISAIVNGSSFLNTGTAAPGEYVSLFANGLGSKDQLDAFPSTVVQGVSVTFNGISAPIADLVAGRGQINLIVPSELPATGTVQVQLTTPTGTGASFPLIMNAAAPGIFLINDPSNAKADIAAAEFVNTAWLVVPSSAAAALGIAQNCTASMANPLSSCAQPAAPGDIVEIYVTGLGEATPKGDPDGTPLATGVVAPANGSVLYETIATPIVELGGIPVTVLFSGITPGTAGEYQIDFTVPTGVTEGDSVPLTVSMPGSTTATATMAIHSS